MGCAPRAKTDMRGRAIDRWGVVDWGLLIDGNERVNESRNAVSSKHELMNSAKKDRGWLCGGGGGCGVVGDLSREGGCVVVVVKLRRKGARVVPETRK